MELGISLYFSGDCIRFRKKLIEELGYPEYLHLYFKKETMKMYIVGCEYDKDAFRCTVETEPPCEYYLYAKLLLEYLSRLIGFKGEESIRLSGSIIGKGIAEVDLTNYEIIPREEVRMNGRYE